MKFVVDEQLSPAVARWLEARGHQAWHVAALDLRSAPDRRIAEAAVERDAVMVTKDRDYLEWRVLIPGLRVLWLRLGDLPNRRLLAEIELGWSDTERLLASGETLVAVGPGAVLHGAAGFP